MLKELEIIHISVKLNHAFKDGDEELIKELTDKLAELTGEK